VVRRCEKAPNELECIQRIAIGCSGILALNCAASGSKIINQTALYMAMTAFRSMSGVQMQTLRISVSVEFYYLAAPNFRIFFTAFRNALFNWGC
jgi:hypothetical protein